MSTREFRERTFQFGIRIVRLVEALPKGEAARVVGRQLLRSGTAVGANYRAATRARSRAEFVAKLGIVEEECDETLYWIDVLIELDLVAGDRCRELLGEGNEILSMVVASIRTARRHKKSAARYDD